MCSYCNGPLIQIDHYGEMLVGCIHCNRWCYPGDEHLIMETYGRRSKCAETRQQLTDGARGLPGCKLEETRPSQTVLTARRRPSTPMILARSSAPWT